MKQNADKENTISIMVLPVKHERGYISTEEINKSNYKCVVSFLWTPDKTGIICAAKMRRTLIIIYQLSLYFC